MTSRIIRPFCYAIVAMLTVVVALRSTSGAAAKKPDKPQWEWQVVITEGSSFQLSSDNGGPYENDGDVEVWVDKASRGRNSLYSFRLLTRNDPAGRQIRFRNVTMTDAGMDFSKGPGYFPTNLCGYPDPSFCQDESDCANRLVDFLNWYHPECDYAAVSLTIEVSLDIENMAEGEPVFLDNADYIGFTIYNTNACAGDPPDDQLHNLQAQNAQKDATSRYSPLWIMRTGPDTWQMWVDSQLDYMNYYEYYYAPLGRGKQVVPEIPLAAYGPFNFEMTWTRIPAGK